MVNGGEVYDTYFHIYFHEYYTTNIPIWIILSLHFTITS